jgi:hypothetical protein
LAKARKKAGDLVGDSIENATEVCSPVSLSACGGSLGDEERPPIYRQPLLKHEMLTSVERVADNPTGVTGFEP